MTDNIKLPPYPEGLCLREDIEDYAREAVRLNAQAVPDGWMPVPVEPTPEMLAAGAVSVLPQASNDIELARSAAMIVLCKPDAPSGVPMELLAATIATMAPYYRAMLSAAPAAPAAPQTTQPLTDEQIEAIYTQETGSLIDDSPWALVDFVRAIEQAHGIGVKT